MTPSSPSFEFSTFLHAGYVAFAFGVLFFGALAFRQVLDDLSVKGLAMGEDLDGYLDAAGITVAGIAWIALVPAVVFCYGILSPSVYIYAIPLILAVHTLQITLRIIFQRTLVRTRGLVVRSVMFERVKAIAFDQIVMVRFVKGMLWTEVRVGLPQEEVGFRIFSFSAQSLERTIQSATTAPVLWSSKREELRP